MGYNDEYSESLVIDIETVASPMAEALLDPVRAPANYKDPDKIRQFQQEKLAEIVQRASLEADLCEVVAFGVMRPAKDEAVYSRQDADEATMLRMFWDEVSLCRLIGYNILQFDLPVLIRRSQLLNVSHPAVNLDRYRTGHIDLLERLSFNGKLTYRSLAFYCRRFNIPSDDVVAGSDIAALVAAGEWAKVEDHCASDVRKTAQLAARLGWFTAVAHHVA